MALNIILGMPKTGKSCYIFDSIKKDILGNIDVILFVPSQQRQETENKYIDHLNTHGIIGVNITTIGEYIKNCLKNIGINTDEKYISKQDKKIILADVISKMTGELKLFRNVSKKEGFLDLIYIYVDLLRKSNFDINILDKLDMENKMVFQKLKEICMIYSNFIDEIREKYIDSVDEIDIFLKNIFKINLSNTKIYIDSYNNFTNNEFKIIDAFLKSADNVTISLSTDISSATDIYSFNTNEIFEISNNTYLKLLDIANKNAVSVSTEVLYNKQNKQKNDIKYLADNIFFDTKLKKKKSENIHIEYFSNVLSEVKNISKIINKKIREGYRYFDFDIYTTDIEKYKEVIIRNFYETKIPIYIHCEDGITSSKLVVYILKYLELLKNGIKKEIIIDLLKLRFVDINEDDIFEFENYVLEFNITDYYISKPFVVNNIKSTDHIYDIDKLNEIRKNILKIYHVDIKKEERAKYYLKVIYDHLNNYVLDGYKKVIDNSSDNTNYFDISYINKEKQVWDKLCEVFNSVAKICKEKITLEKFIQIFRLAIKDVYLKSTPPVIDAVNLFDINIAKQNVSKIAFFVGVNENEFPKISTEDVIFSDVQLNALKESGVELRNTTASKDNMAKYNIYSVLNGIKEELYVSIPTSDYSGKSLKPSPIISEIKKLLDVKINCQIEEDKEDNICDMYSKNQLLEYMLKRLNKNQNDNDDVKYIYQLLQKDELYNELFNYRKDDSNLKEETLKLVYSDKLNTSVSRLELFKKCPFSYYMQYLLKISPRKEFEISNMDIGNFMHSVLEKFSKYLWDNNISWCSLILDISWYDKLTCIIDESLTEQLGSKTSSIKYVILKEKLINTMKKVICVISNSFNQSKFEPFGYEIEFKEGKIFAPIQIKLDDMRTMNIIGKIDRVDSLRVEDEMYVRIVDYKSSQKDLDLDDIKEGISLQLVTYLSSVIENLKKNEKLEVKPAAMLYFNLSDKLVNLKEYIDDEEKVKKETIKFFRMKGIFLKDIDVIEKMDNKLDTDSRLIDVTKISLNKVSTKRALSTQEYKSLFEETKHLLKTIGEDIINGVVKIAPNKKAKYCNFCNYSSICRKDSCV